MNFNRAFGHIIGIEGGFSDHVADPGGATKYGITWRTLEAAIAKGLVPAGTKIVDLTVDQAKTIYRAFYWTEARCESLPWPLAMLVFDAAVNQGVGVSTRLLQKTLGVAQDGVIGNNTLTAIQRANQRELCALYLADRALRYTGTRNFDVFGRGWLKRLFVIAMDAA